MDSLATKTALRKLKVALSTLPDGLAATYDGIMQRISLQGNENSHLARRVLSWIVNAMTPLTPLVLRQALAIEDQDTSLDVENMPDADLLVTVCQGLINIHQDTGFIGFVHHTTQEYFKDKSFGSYPEAQKDILRTCLTFLSFPEFGNGLCGNRRDFRKWLKEYPLLAYAGTYVRENYLLASTVVNERSFPFSLLHVVCWLESLSVICVLNFHGLTPTWYHLEPIQGTKFQP